MESWGKWLGIGIVVFAFFFLAFFSVIAEGFLFVHQPELYCANDSMTGNSCDEGFTVFVNVSQVCTKDNGLCATNTSGLNDSIVSINQSLNNEIFYRMINDTEIRNRIFQVNTTTNIKALGFNVTSDYDERYILQQGNGTLNGSFKVLGQRLDVNGGWLSPRGVSFINGDLFMDGSLFLTGNISSVNVSSISMNGSWLPEVDNTFDLGNESFRWRSVHGVTFFGALDWSFIQNPPWLNATDQRYNDTSRIDDVNSSLQNEISNRVSNESDIRNAISTLQNLTLAQIVANIGNWSSDRPNYVNYSSGDARYYNISNPRNYKNVSKNMCSNIGTTGQLDCVVSFVDSSDVTVWAKGDILLTDVGGNNNPVVRLTRNGTIIDIARGSIGVFKGTMIFPFAFMFYNNSMNGKFNYSITATSGTLNNTRIIVETVRE